MKKITQNRLLSLIFNKFYLLQHFSNFLISLKIVSRVFSFRLGCSRFARHTLYIQLYQLTETNFQLRGRNLSSRRRVKILGRPKKGGGEKKGKEKKSGEIKLTKILVLRAPTPQVARRLVEVAANYEVVHRCS